MTTPTDGAREELNRGLRIDIALAVANRLKERLTDLAYYNQAFMRYEIEGPAWEDYCQKMAYMIVELLPDIDEKAQAELISARESEARQSAFREGAEAMAGKVKELAESFDGTNGGWIFFFCGEVDRILSDISLTPGHE